MRAWRYYQEQCYCYYIIELCSAPSYLLVLSRDEPQRVRVCNASQAQGACGFGVSCYAVKWEPCEVEEAIAYALRVS